MQQLAAIFFFTMLIHVNISILISVREWLAQKLNGSLKERCILIFCEIVLLLHKVVEYSRLAIKITYNIPIIMAEMLCTHLDFLTINDMLMIRVC